MKRVLAMIAAASLVLASACATTGTGGVSETDWTTAGGVAAESAAQIRCPRTPAEVAAFLAARLAFDITAGRKLDTWQQALLAQARASTNLACNIAPAPTPPAPPG